MLCIECWDNLKKNMITGEPNNAGQILKSVSATKKSVFTLSNNFIPIWIVYDQPIKSGKNKGKMKEIEEQFNFKSSYCPKCGREHEDIKGGSLGLR